ncbi:MAG: MBL fold metallo-hydrolase [Odoribacter sp.]|nr:MBL fold metallo-hydrolase [Odoribacter sp.]
MKLIYIYHSGFVIKAEEFSLLIDYYRDTPDKMVHEKLLNDPGKLYVLASHAHADHFNPEILSWKNKRPDIQYIFSEDIRTRQPICFSDTIFLSKGESWCDNLVKIKALGSTDIGISFLIDAGGKRIFHAGDLNNWHWQEESTPEEIAEAETDYLNELETLAQNTAFVDVALFPVDPRLGKDYAKGALQFTEHIRTGLFAPMHFWEKYDKANAIQAYIEKHGSKFIAIHHPGESIEL